MKKFQIIRFVHGKKQTIGKIVIKSEGENFPVVYLNAFSLELPWKNNDPFVSRIPPGIYPIEERSSVAHGKHVHIKDVPDRYPILIHAGNVYDDTEGCPLPGNGIKDIDGDGTIDVTGSRKTLNMILGFIEVMNLTEIEIIDGDHTDLEELC